MARPPRLERGTPGLEDRFSHFLIQPTFGLFRNLCRFSEVWKAVEANGPLGLSAYYKIIYSELPGLADGSAQWCQ